MQLRDYQKESIDALYSYFRNNKTGNPVIVAPTGSGKSVIIAGTITDILTRWSDKRIVLLTHVKELVEQNYSALKRYWKVAPAGIYSAGLGKRDGHHAITFATIQSVVKKPDIIGIRDLIMIDEVHLVSHNDDTSYRKFIAAMEMFNPNVRVVGYTATPYRLDTGIITEGNGAIFDAIAHEIPITHLLGLKMLSPLVCRYNAELQASMQDVRITAGEFNAADMAEKFEQLIEPVCKDIAEKAAERKSIIVFCPRVDICFSVSRELAKHGIDSDVLTGETPKTERREIIDRFKRGELRCIVSVNVITTGFDAPNVDCIALFRATVSAGLYYQMLGRGMRLHEGKENCLVLDYGGNIKRHGAITAIIPPKKRGAREIREEEEKKFDMLVCPKCTFVHFKPYPDNCDDCGHLFPKEEREPAVDKYNTKAENLDPMFSHSKQPMPPQWIKVDRWSAKLHQKQGKQPTMQVTYDCGLIQHREWICFEHIGYAGDKAYQWYWRMRSMADKNSLASFGGQLYVAKAVELDFPHLKCPTHIKVKEEGKYWRILDYRWDEVKQQQEEWLSDDVTF